MAAPYSTILYKVDRAFVAYLTAAGISNVCTGKSSVDKTAPIVICYSESGVEEPYQSGNWKVKTNIIVKTSAGVDTDGIDPAPANAALVGQTFDAIMQGIAGDTGNATALADLISAQGITDFTAFNVCRTGIEQSFDGDCWTDTLTLEVYCCPSTVA